MRDDGSRWDRMKGRSFREIVTGWGATRVYQTERQRTMTTYMVEFPEGWRYAHEWDGAVYVSNEEPIQAENGEEAALRRELARAKKNVTRAEASLTEAQETYTDVMDRLNALLVCQSSRK